MSNNPATLFVWRGRRDLTEDEAFNPWFGWGYTCPFCKESLVLAAQEQHEAGSLAPEDFWEDPDDRLPPQRETGGSETSSYYMCPLCGWIFISSEGAFFGLTGEVRWGTTLREFPINDSSVSLAELGSYLNQNFSDLYTLSWERFEDLAADILRRTQHRTVVQTARTMDGGADILLLSEDGSSIDAIVECKKYAKTRKIGVELVRQLVGACVDWDVRDATLITSSAFTSNAIDLATRFGTRGFRVELVAAADLMSLLSCYSEVLPPLHLLSEAERLQLIQTNQDAIRNSVVIPPAMEYEKSDRQFLVRHVVKRYL